MKKKREEGVSPRGRPENGSKVKMFPGTEMDDRRNASEGVEAGEGGPGSRVRQGLSRSGGKRGMKETLCERQGNYLSRGGIEKRSQRRVES